MPVLRNHYNSLQHSAPKADYHIPHSITYELLSMPIMTMLMTIFMSLMGHDGVYLALPIAMDADDGGDGDAGDGGSIELTLLVLNRSVLLIQMMTAEARASCATRYASETSATFFYISVHTDCA